MTEILPEPAWHRPENLRDDYVPPVVQQGHVTAAWFWGLAVWNGRMRGDDPALIAWAESRAKAARQQQEE